jgi:hypothetical protein
MNGPTNFLNLDYFFYQIYRLLVWIGVPLRAPQAGTRPSSVVSESFFDSSFWLFLKNFLLVLIIVLITIILYSLVRIWEVREEEKKKMNDLYAKQKAAEAQPVKNTQWERVLAHVNSTNSSEWRLAIIEADTMLEDFTKQMGIPGDTLGDRLKNADISDIRKKDSAWEAHKVRNRIAHDGSAFELSQRDAKIAIDQFEEVFKDMGQL